MWKKLFGRAKGPPPRDVAELVAPLVQPAVHLIPTSEPTGSFLGGDPPPELQRWPEANGARLGFLACLDLAALAATHVAPWLPAEGRLLFFYDVESQPWGFDPNHRGSWAVIHTPAGAAAPQPIARAARHDVTLHSIRTHPSWERAEVEALELSDTEQEILIALDEAARGERPHHQVGGYPEAIQGDYMELECQLVSHGLYCGGTNPYESPEALALRDGAADWRLLLQLATDDALEMSWGDAGLLYFWIRESDARAGRFENVWVVLQCH